MRLSRHFFAGCLLLIVFLVPFGAAAQSSGTMFDPIIPEECKCEQVDVVGGGTSVSAPNWGCVLKVVQNVINTAVALSVVIVVLAIAYAGFVFMTNGPNPGARTQAKQVILNSVVGLAILLGAWLLVDTLMKFVYDPAAIATGNTAFGPWNSIWAPGPDDMCLVVRQPTPITSGVIGTISDVISPTTGGGAAGSCTVPTGGPCSAAALSASFGGAASQAAQICTAESGGNPQRLSATDRTSDGRAYSVGLFQINLTNSFNHQVNGRNCSEAFSGPCQGRAVVQSGSSAGRCNARIVNEALYGQCVAAAQNPSINIAAARTLYDGDWGRWSTATRCNLPR